MIGREGKLDCHISLGWASQPLCQVWIAQINHLKSVVARFLTQLLSVYRKPSWPLNQFKSGARLPSQLYALNRKPPLGSHSISPVLDLQGYFEQRLISQLLKQAKAIFCNWVKPEAAFFLQIYNFPHQECLAWLLVQIYKLRWGNFAFKFWIFANFCMFLIDVLYALKQEKCLFWFRRNISP